MITVRRSFRKKSVDVSSFSEAFVGLDRLKNYCETHSVTFPDDPLSPVWKFLTHKKVEHDSAESVVYEELQGIMVRAKAGDREYMQLLPETDF